MYSRDAGNELNHDRTLTGALRALPDASPPDLWPTLARDLARRRSPMRRHARPLALAAAALLAIGAATLYVATTTMRATQERVVQTPSPKPSPSIARTATTTTASAELERVRSQSQSIERWLAAVAARTPQSSGDSMAAIEVEDLIGLVDVQLSGARDAGEALPLWRQRVSLLEDLAAIRSHAFSLAETGVATNGSAAALHHMVN